MKKKLERTPETLADLLEKQMVGKRKLCFTAESKDEAALVAKELRKRGWRTSVSVGIVWPGGFEDPKAEARGANFVNIGRRRMEGT